MLHVHALDRADPLGEVEHLGLRERLGRVEAPARARRRSAGSGTPRSSSRSRTSGRTRSPRRSRSAPSRTWIVVDRRRRDDRRRSGRRRPRARAPRPCRRVRAGPARFPLGGSRELLQAERRADESVRVLGVGDGRGHRHVDVRGAGLERGRRRSRRLRRGSHAFITASAPTSRRQGGDGRRVARVDRRGAVQPIVAETSRRPRSAARGRGRRRRARRRTTGGTRSPRSTRRRLRSRPGGSALGPCVQVASASASGRRRADRAPRPPPRW